ncbi:ABC transporter ATP-binding protein [soil metagenome]
MAISAPAAANPYRPVEADRLSIVNHGAAVETTALAIETRGLTKRYGSIAAVDALDLGVRRGEVYGFLGPNGAGKTTTLRMLLGLIEQTNGSISLMGSKPGSPETLVNIGSMIETPAFYPFLSGHDNLKMLAAYTGAVRRRIDEVLDQVDLAARARDSFASYSLGMKQRLGVAAALLKDPPLLLLDEPTNGLDPAGMADMRTLIRRLGDEGRTVLLSSHLMNEVEQVCDRVGVIACGKIVAEGTVGELRGQAALIVRVDQPQQAREIVDEFRGIASIEITGNTLRIATAADVAIDGAMVNRRLVEAGIAVHELRTDRRSLEDIFLTLTNEEVRHAS